ncbi:hypothetical protein HYX17_03250 [Candidatus Woesearchaeota archaeon]|nr:hypothetical protein [Candidatus Woesearchaeota archaeon]
MSEIASRDEVLNFIYWSFCSAKDGINSDFFFNKLKKDLPKSLDHLLRLRISSECDRLVKSGTSTEVGYKIAYDYIQKLVKKHYRTYHTHQAVA